jgi:broad specificity phosphatase PhoE
MIVLLVRHAANDSIGRFVAGRTAGINLNEEGRLQVGRLATRMANRRVDAIYSSPLERALQTAEGLAAPRGLGVTIRESLTEIDYGKWTGIEFERLEKDPMFLEYNEIRSCSRAPGGESMLDVQRRMVAEVEWFRDRHANDTIAVVSHGDPIRAVLAYFTGIPIDLSLRIEIGLASVSTLAFQGTHPRLLELNDGGQPLIM